MDGDYLYDEFGASDRQGGRAAKDADYHLFLLLLLIILSLMPSTQFIVHNCKQILLMDFSGAHSTAEIYQMAEEAQKIVAIYQPQSLLGLVDFTGMKIDGGKIKIIKDMAAHNRPYMRFIALVGLRFPRSILFRVMLRLTGRKNHSVFGNREKALEWLAGFQ